VTAKIFQAFACRDLGLGESVLHVDYTIDCNETALLRWVGGGALVLLWPIGLPTTLFVAMHRVREKILDDDEDTVKVYDFVLGDYNKEHWYWEVVELGRKLILAGLIGLVRPLRHPNHPSKAVLPDTGRWVAGGQGLDRTERPGHDDLLLLLRRQLPRAAVRRSPAKPRQDVHGVSDLRNTTRMPHHTGG
jgi:hypothetical protein